jgi:hypothetical protein
MKCLIFTFIFMALPVASFGEIGDVYLDPHVAVGFNSAQGMHLLLGADLGLHVTENVNAGIGGYYSAGERPEHDREFGGGPFLSYVEQFNTFLVGHLRQELNYVDLHDPVKVIGSDGTVTYTHTSETGIASVTSAALHIYFTPNFVLSGGYRLVTAITNSALDDGRSGAFVGVSLGI